MFDMFGGVEVLEVLWDCWGEWGLEGKKDNTDMPWSVKYLYLHVKR